MVDFVGADSGGGNSTSITDLTWPSVAAGDVALLWWVMTNTTTATNPSGFTLEQQLDGDSGSMRVRFQSKICTGAESGALTLTGDTTNRMSACLAVYRGCHPTSPVNAFTSNDEGSSVSTHACAAVTPTVPSAVIVTAVSERATTGTTNWTTSYTERTDSLTLATGTGGTITAIADDGLAAGRGLSAVTPPNWVSADTFSTANVITWSVALASAPSSAPPNPVRRRAHLLVR